MRIDLLGSLQVVCAGRRCTPSAPKLRKVLALLVLHANEVVPTGSLVEELWGQHSPSSALTTLQTYVYQLRKLLGSAQGRPGDGVLVTAPGGYLVRVEPDAVDLWRFERLAADGRVALEAGDPRRTSQLLREALAQWRGPALADVSTGPLLSPQVARLEESHNSALEHRLDADLQLGMHRELIGELKSLVAADPLREGYHGQLMLALHRCGRRVEALESFQHLRKVLADELGLEPSVDLQRLQQQVLSADPALDFQPLTPRTITLAAFLSPPAQLPPDITDFVGRAATLDTIEGLLVRTDETRTAVPVATLIGMAGAGKTVTAVHAAQCLRGYFPDGQLYADLRGMTDDPDDPAEVLAGFLRAIGFSNEQMPGSVEERSRMMRSWCADRRVLLLLDDAHGAAQVRPLLPGGTRCAVIVTARSPLHGLAGAATVELDPMHPSEAVQLLTTIVGYERVGLEPSAAETIVRQCGYLPLAIRAAAARLLTRKHWPLSKLAVRLAIEPHQLSELHTGELNLRASFEPSYRALSHQERNAFRQLSELDEPEFPVWMAAALLNVDTRTAEMLLGRLTEVHLLRATSTDPDGEVYYGFHELLRPFAREMSEEFADRLTEPTLADRLPRRPSADAPAGLPGAGHMSGRRDPGAPDVA